MLFGIELAAPTYDHGGDRVFKLLARFPDGRDETILEMDSGNASVSHRQLASYFVELLRNLRDAKLIGNAGPETKSVISGEDGRIIDREPFGREAALRGGGEDG